MNRDRLRNSISALTADLRSRRLLAVVGLLVVVAIAIPLLLVRSGTAASVTGLAPTPVVTTPEATAAPVSTPRHREPLRNYLKGPAHNPFATTAATTAGASSAAPASSGSSESASSGVTASTGSSKSASSGVTASTGSSSTGNSTSPGSSSASSAAAAATPTTATVTTPAKTTTVTETTTVIKTVTKPPPFADYEAAVSLRRDGPGSTARMFNRLSRDQLLPSDAGAFASFLGIRQDTHTAVFVLAEGVGVTGHGRCAPSTAKCIFLTLQPGQSAKLESPAWAGFKTFTLRFARVDLVTSSASVVNVDPSGRTALRRTATTYALLRTISYGRFNGLLKIKLGATVPVAP